MLVIIDNGHGQETPGKRSPDGRVQEWRWTREVAQRLADTLARQGIATHRLTPEHHDTDLATRVRRANALARRHKGAALLVSIHCNAQGNGSQWHEAHGWSVYVSHNASPHSRALAQQLAAAARTQGFALRDPHASTSVDYWVQNLAICRDTTMPAVLVENFFMDHRDDCHFLSTAQGQQACAQVMARGITSYIAHLCTPTP